MNIKFQSAVIIAKDFNKLKHFYTKILMQEIEYDFGNCITLKGGLSIWELKPSYTVSKCLGRTFSEKGNNNLEICFDTNEFDEVYQTLIKYDIIFLHNIIEESWGQRTIRFYDPENNIIEIGETLECFVNKFHNQGMTIEQISEKTSINTEIITKILKI